MSELFTREFWLETADRAIKSFAQAMLLAWGAGELFDIWSVDWRTTLGFGLGGAAISVLTSIAAAGFNKSRGATGMLSVPGSTPPEAGP